MNIETVCNTPDDVLFAHIEQNSRRPIPWVKSVDAHDGQAVIVGGGPSVAEWLHEISYRKSIGQTIFALNNAAKFLLDAGIEADYQIIVDARESNAAFIGYAKHCLLASQCHPSLFDKAGAVTLWHQEYPDDLTRFDACLPGECNEHALIGGGTTVGLSAMALVYALGYRKLHLYGYDSSHRGEASHAYTQSDPQSVPCVCTVAGKSFRTSLAMARQAELFPQLSDTLIDAGCLITLRGDGLLPWTSKAAERAPVAEHLTEQQKYETMWGFNAYRIVSPGELVAQDFVTVCRPEGTVLDIGCGTGRGALAIEKRTECKLLLVDFTANSRDPEAQRLEFLQADITQDIPAKGDYGFCADVMEHIPPVDVDRTIVNIMKATPQAFFQISLVDDAMGALIGHPLHLSVHPFAWWAAVFSRLGYRTKWSEDRGNTAVFYVSTT